MKRIIFETIGQRWISYFFAEPKITQEMLDAVPAGTAFGVIYNDASGSFAWQSAVFFRKADGKYTQVRKQNSSTRWGAKYWLSGQLHFYNSPYMLAILRAEAR